MTAPESDHPYSIRAPFAPRLIGGIRAPMIGRDDALQQILAHFYAMDGAGDAALISVIAAPGLGKSRLAYEIMRTVTQTTTQVISVHADSDSVRPYDLIRRLVIAQFDIDEVRDPDGGFSRLLQGSIALLGPEGERAAHLIGTLLGIGTVQAAPADGDARSARYEALILLMKGIRAIAARGPVLMLIDDLHDADQASLEVIEVILRTGRDLPLLIVGFAQPHLDSRMPTLPTIETARIVLTPLSDHLARRLVGELLRKAGRLPPELRTSIVGNAEGNPRYIEELIAALIAEGVITPGAESWQINVARLARVRMPATMTELFRRRVQAMTPENRTLLIAAALVGRAFWLGAIHVQLPDIAQNEGAQQLDVLLGAGLIVAVDSQIIGEREFRFAHNLGHEAALAMLPADERPPRHRAVAEWMAAHGEEHAALIGAHYAQAGDQRAAATWLLQAGKQAEARYAIEAGIAAYRQALRALASVPESQAEQLSANEALGGLLREQARLNEALDAYQRMLDLAVALNDRHAAARAWYGMSRTQDDQIETRAARASARNARDLAVSLSDSVLLARVLIQLAMTEARLGGTLTALELCNQALNEIAEVPDRDIHAATLAQLAITYEQLEQFNEARHTMEAAIAILREIKQQSTLAYHLSNLGYICNSMAAYRDALEILRESVAIAESIDSRIGMIFALSNLGVSLNSLGYHDEAEAAMQRGIALCEQTRMAPFPDFYRGLALADLGRGRIPEAVEAAQRSLELARHEEDPREIAISWRALGMTFAAMDDHHAARPCFSESARLLDEIGRRSDRARTLEVWASYEAALGDPARAVELITEAQQLFAAIGMPLAG